MNGLHRVFVLDDGILIITMRRLPDLSLIERRYITDFC